jgi:hypothetical protein
VISLVILAAAIPALYVFHLAGIWRVVYIVGAVIALYLNAFVGVVQAFQKLSFLQPLALTQSEPPFIVAQLVLLAIFVALGIGAVKRFHPDMSTARHSGSAAYYHTSVLAEQIQFSSMKTTTELSLRRLAAACSRRAGLQTPWETRRQTRAKTIAVWRRNEFPRSAAIK